MHVKNGSKDLKRYPQISRRVRDTLARLLIVRVFVGTDQEVMQHVSRMVSRTTIQANDHLARRRTAQPANEHAQALGGWGHTVGQQHHDNDRGGPHAERHVERVLQGGRSPESSTYPGRSLVLHTSAGRRGWGEMALQWWLGDIDSLHAVGNLTGAGGNSTNPSIPIIADCHLLGGAFSYMIQLACGFLAIGSLVVKRATEAPQRPWNIWLMDVAKQVTSGAAAHFAGLNNAHLLHRLSDSGNECSWYLISFTIDTSLG